MKLDLDNYSAESKIPKIKGKFIDRELSWLMFNSRVLYCANNPEIPLNERLKFLAITCNNLDEFIAVRYSNALKEADKKLQKKILKGIKDSMELQYATYLKLKEELKKEGVVISRLKDLSKKEKEKIHKIFRDEIFPLLTPINIGSTNEIPNFFSGQNCIALTIKQSNTENLIFVPINKNLCDMYTIGNRVIMIEDIILEYLSDLFINKDIISYGYFRVVKDESIILTHDRSKFLLDRMSSIIEQRTMSDPEFIAISKDTPKRLQKILISVFGIDDENVFSEANVLDYTITR